MQRKWLALGALALSLFVVGLDLTILNVALPTLARDLDASTGQLQWFADSYNLVLAALLIPAGLLGDRFGRKRMLLIALALFGIASLGCALSDTPGELIAARAALGFGAAFLMPLGMAILPVLFTAEERPKAIAAWVAANTLGIPLGPIIGGYLLDHYDWGSVFLINLPVVAVGLVAITCLLPESRDPSKPRIDVRGALLSSAGLVAITYGVIEGGERGWGDPRTLATLAAGVIALLLFARVQRLIDTALFRSRAFTWGAILATLSTFSLFGLLFVMPQFFSAVLRADAFGTGLRLLPVIGGLLVGSQLAERLVPRLAAPRKIAFGFALMAAALFAGATTGVDTGYGFTAAWMAWLGIGLGFVMPPAMNAALGELSPARSGVGSAVLMAMRQVGGTIGVAVLGTIFAASYKTPQDGPAAFVHGMDAALATCGVVALAGIALALVFLPSARTAQSVHVSPEPA
jgi:DHA2 family multidrug resistance protein-like MFS transporter